MKPGDLVLYNGLASQNTTRSYFTPKPALGVILNEENHAFEYRFFNVILCGGMVKLISDHYLELIYEQKSVE